MTPRFAIVGRLCLVAVAGVLLAGCVSLPDSSAVKSGRGAGVDKQGSLIKYSPPGPEAGAPRQAIIEGYLAAMLAFPSDPVLVRQFMSPSAAKAWHPDERLQVYEEPSIAQVGAGLYLTARILGSVDTRGSWSSTTGPEAAMNLRVSMIKVDDQLRIDNPVPGTLMDADHFSRYYHQYSLYFFDPTYTLLTPDPVYLQLGTPSTTSTSLVRDLLLGPTSDMAGVVQSAAPVPTRLSPSVSVSSSGYADVPLSSNVGSLQPGQIRSLAAQLAWTLRQEHVGVNHIRIKVNGRALTVQGLGSVFSVENFHDPTITPASRTLYALSDKGHLFTVSSGRADPVTGPIGATEIKARSMAINASATFAALVNEDGMTVVAGGLTQAQSDSPAKIWFRSGSDLLRPSWDASGLLWLVDLRGRQAVLEVATKSVSRVVDAPGIAGEDVRAFALSRDGMRFAAVLGEGNQSHLVVAMIKRNAKHLTDVSLVGRRFVVNSDFPLSNINGLAWVNPTTVVVLAQDRSSEAQPYEVSVDGSHVEPTTGFLPIRPVSVASGAGSGAPSVIGSSDGVLYVRTADEQWARLTATQKLSGPAYPG
jgi:Lipoprotein LpqB beta-propeller domain